MNKQFNEIEGKISQEYEKLKREIERPNILLVGGTGVGKSSLINLCFGKTIAEVGIGKPVTQCLDRFKIPDMSLVLFDTKGYELGSEKHTAFLNEVVNYAVENKMEKHKQIHIVWYCIQASGHRILDLDVDIIKKFNRIGIPICIIFTKCDIVTENEMTILGKKTFKELPNINQFQISMPKAGGSMQLSTKSNLNYFDLENLCSWSINSLPQGLKFAFISAQKINLNTKREEANNIVVQHSSASAFVGFAPIPFSDAPILLVNQTGMLVRILFIYDMQSLTPAIQGMIGALGIPTILSNTGIWITGQLLKLIPGLGSIAGGLISASIAASLTSVIGFSIIEFCHGMYKLVLDGNLEKVESYIKNADTIFEKLVNEKYHKL